MVMEQLSQNKQLSPLEALKIVKNNIINDYLNIDYKQEKNYLCLLDIIEIALKRLEEYKKCIDLDVANYISTHNMSVMDTETYNLLHKRSQALEIIKEKNINVRGIINSSNLEYYIDHCMPRNSKEPTQEEYDLLKEVLCDE